MSLDVLRGLSTSDQSQELSAGPLNSKATSKVTAVDRAIIYYFIVVDLCGPIGLLSIVRCGELLTNSMVVMGSLCPWMWGALGGLCSSMVVMGSLCPWM